MVSVYLPSFPPQNVVPGFAFPTVGRLGFTSPPYRMPKRRHPSVLCSAKTAKSPSRETSLREAIVARYLACTQLFVSLPITSYRGRLAATPKCKNGHSARSLDTPVHLRFRLSCKETDGSPEFPGYPYVHMPRSKTPEVSWILAHYALRTAAFHRFQSVGFHPD